MKFFTVLSALGLVAAAVAQQTTHNSTVASTLSTSTSASLTPEQSCLAECGLADICCQANCAKVPCPNPSQVNATTECAARCPQGNGTAGDTAQYASCQSSCISSYFLTANTVSTSFIGSVATNSAGSTTGSVETTSATGGSGASSGASSTASATGSSSSSKGAADHLQLGVTSAGILGLVAMAFAL